MKCEKIIEMLEELSPPSFASSWDNVGLQVGRKDKEVHKILVTVDVTEDVVEQAVCLGADMILAHHPLIFGGIKKVTTDDFIGKRVIKLIEHDISCYVAHTNFDVMGMADAAADELSLKEREVLEITFEDEIAKEGFGRVGKLPKSMTLSECAQFVKQQFGIECVKVFGNLDKVVETAAISPGSGKTTIRAALTAKTDVMITGDIDHHDGLDAVAQGMAIIDAGHFELEKIFIPFMEEYLRRKVQGVEIARARQTCPFQIM